MKQKGVLRDLLEGMLSGKLSADEVRAELWIFDLELASRKKDTNRWWVVCKDHSSSYITELQAETVRKAIVQLGIDRPHLGCHNEHLIVQSATDPRGVQGILGVDVDDAQRVADVELCYWCDKPLGVTVTPIRVKVGGQYTTVFIHSPSTEYTCWSEWRKTLDLSTEILNTPQQEWSNPPAAAPASAPAASGLRQTMCVRCGEQIYTTYGEGPTRWWAERAIGGPPTFIRKVYTCHPPEIPDTAHSEHTPVLAGV